MARLLMRIEGPIDEESGEPVWVYEEYEEA